MSIQLNLFMLNDIDRKTNTIFITIIENYCQLPKNFISNLKSYNV